MVDARKTTESLPGETPQKVQPGRTGGSQTVYSLTEEETVEFGRNFAQQLRGGERILLHGDLGLGKTVFARGIAAGLGVAEEDVHSPSFTLVQEYSGGRLPIFHVDLYRLDEEDDFESLGLAELMSGGGVVLIEWGERLPGHLQRDAFSVTLHDIGEGSRRIEFRSPPEPGPIRAGDA